MKKYLTNFILFIIVGIISAVILSKVQVQKEKPFYSYVTGKVYTPGHYCCTDSKPVYGRFDEIREKTVDSISYCKIKCGQFISLNQIRF